MRDNDPEWLKQAERAFLDEARDEAERITREALQDAEAAGDVPAMIRALEYLTFLLMAQFNRRDEYEETKLRWANLKESHARRMIAEIEAEKGPDHPDLTHPLLELADVLKTRLYEGRHSHPENTRELDELFRQARALHDRVEAICLNTHGEGSIEYARHMMRDADLAGRIAGNPDEAIGLVKRALDIFRRSDPLSKDSRVAQFRLAFTLAEAGRLEDAAAAYEQILAAEPDDESSNSVKSLLGMAYERMGKVDEALALQREANVASEQALAEKPYLASPSAYHLAGELARAGKLQEAEAEYRKALELNAMAPREQLMVRGIMQGELADCLCKLGRAKDGVAMARESLKNIEAELGGTHVRVAESLLTICDCLIDAGDEAAVSEPLSRAADIILSLPDAGFVHDDGLARACIELLETYEKQDIAQRIRARLAKLPEKWTPPR